MDKEVLINHTRQYAYVYKHRALTPNVHYRLVLNMMRYAVAAGIQPEHIFKSLPKDTPKTIVAWIKSYPFPKNGALIQGVKPALFEAITGCFLRNFISARYITLQNLITLLKGNDHPSETILLIPNFFLRKKNGGNIPNWELSLLYSYLLERSAKGKYNILLAEDLSGIQSEYGSNIYEHIVDNYTIIGI